MHLEPVVTITPLTDVAPAIIHVPEDESADLFSFLKCRFSLRIYPSGKLDMDVRVTDADYDAFVALYPETQLKPEEPRYGCHFVVAGHERVVYWLWADQGHCI